MSAGLRESRPPTESRRLRPRPDRPECLEVLALLVLGLLQLLDRVLELLDLSLLVVELLDVPLVGFAGGRHLLEVRPQPGLVLANVFQKPALVGDLLLGA